MWDLGTPSARLAPGFEARKLAPQPPNAKACRQTKDETTQANREVGSVAPPASNAGLGAETNVGSEATGARIPAQGQRGRRKAATRSTQIAQYQPWDWEWPQAPQGLP